MMPLSIELMQGEISTRPGVQIIISIGINLEDYETLPLIRNAKRLYYENHVCYTNLLTPVESGFTCGVSTTNQLIDIWHIL